MYFHGPQKWSDEARHDLLTLSDVLDIRLREVLREELGSVYQVGTWGDLQRIENEYTFAVYFGCAPENVEKLRKALLDELRAVQAHGVSPAGIAKLRESQRRAHEVMLKENGYWLRQISHAWAFGDDPKAIAKIQPFLDRITSQRVRAAAQRYLRSGEYVLGFCVPKVLPPALWPPVRPPPRCCEGSTGRAVSR